MKGLTRDAHGSVGRSRRCRRPRGRSGLRPGRIGRRQLADVAVSECGRVRARPSSGFAERRPVQSGNVWPVLQGIRRLRGYGSVLCTLSTLNRAECKNIDSDRIVSIGGVDDFVVWGWWDSVHLCGRKKPGPWTCKTGSRTGAPDRLDSDVDSAVSAVAGDHTAYVDPSSICVVDPAGGVACRPTSESKGGPRFPRDASTSRSTTGPSRRSSSVATRPACWGATAPSDAGATRRRMAPTTAWARPSVRRGDSSARRTDHRSA